MQGPLLPFPPHPPPSFLPIPFPLCFLSSSPVFLLIHLMIWELALCVRVTCIRNEEEHGKSRHFLFLKEQFLQRDAL